MHCYQIICQIAKKLLLKGCKFILGWLVGVRIYSERMYLVSKSHIEYTDINCNAHDLMRLYIKALVVRC